MDNPAARALILLVLALPGVGLLGHWLTTRGLGRADAAWFTPATTLGIWLTAVHVLGLLFQSFYPALVAGTVLPSLAGITLVGLRGAAAQAGRQSDTEPITAWPILLAASLGTLAILPAVVGYDFHDKLVALSGHCSITAEILNGIYPPRDLAFAERPLVYHYGVDTLFAMVAAIFHLQPAVAIDYVTGALWFYYLCLLGKVGGTLFGPGAAVLSVFLGGFGGGLPWLVGHGGNTTLTLLGLIAVRGKTINPTLAWYFFQHPWTIGLPMALLAVHIQWRLERGETSANPCALLCIALATLGIANTTLFLTLAAASAAALAWRLLHAPEPARRARFVWAIGTILAATVYTAGLGGMSPLLLGQTGGGSALGLASAVLTRDFRSMALWDIGSFGLLLPVGAAGLAMSAALRCYFLLLACGGFLICNLLDYKFSWDIVKFATLAQFVLALHAVPVVARLSRHSRLAAAVLSAGLTSAALIFHSLFWLGVEDIPYPVALAHNRLVTTLSPDDDQAIAWLRRHVAPGEIVARSSGAALPYAVLGGLPQLAVDRNTPALGLDPAKIGERSYWMTHPPDRLEVYRRIGVAWIVVDTRPGANDPYASIRWVGEAPVVAARMGELTVYRVPGKLSSDR